MKHRRLPLHRTPARLALAGALALAAFLSLSAVALASWGTAGHSISRVEWTPTVCGDGVRAHVAFEPLSQPGLVDTSTHPFAPVELSVTATASPTEPPTGTVVAEQIAALPLHTVWAPLSDTDPISLADQFAYSGEVLLPYDQPLPPGSLYVTLWSSGGYFKGLGTSAVPISRCSVQGSLVTSGCFGAQPTIFGTHGDDVLTGTADSDVIEAGAGNDTIDGLGRDDLVCGGPGDDVIKGGAGNDALDGGDGADRLADSGGNDLLVGGAGPDTLYGWSGDDILQGGPGDDSLVGKLAFWGYVESSGRDALDGGSGSDSCYLGDMVVNCAP
jgi:hypothetical protein